MTVCIVSGNNRLPTALAAGTPWSRRHTPIDVQAAGVTGRMRPQSACLLVFRQSFAPVARYRTIIRTTTAAIGIMFAQGCRYPCSESPSIPSSPVSPKPEFTALPAISALVGTYEGWDDIQVDYFRLSLYANGRGVVSKYWAPPFDLGTIQERTETFSFHWRVKGQSLECYRPTANSTMPMDLRIFVPLLGIAAHRPLCQRLVIMRDEGYAPMPEPVQLVRTELLEEARRQVRAPH